jgi:hypothetical protein
MCVHLKDAPPVIQIPCFVWYCGFEAKKTPTSPRDPKKFRDCEKKAHKKWGEGCEKKDTGKMDSACEDLKGCYDNYY